MRRASEQEPVGIGRGADEREGWLGVEYFDPHRNLRTLLPSAR